MKFSLIYLWITTSLCISSASALPHRYRGVYYDTKFLNNLNPRNRRTTAAAAEQSTAAEPTAVTTKTDSTSSTKNLKSDIVLVVVPGLVKTIKESTPGYKNTGGKIAEEKLDTDRQNTKGRTVKDNNSRKRIAEKATNTRNRDPEDPKKNATSSNLDDILNYDYEYLTYLYELDFLDLGKETKAPTKVATADRTRKLVRIEKVLNNEPALPQAKAISSNSKGITNLKSPTSTNLKTISQKEKVRRSFRYTTATPEDSKTSEKISQTTDVQFPQSNQETEASTSPKGNQETEVSTEPAKVIENNETEKQNIVQTPTHHVSNNSKSDLNAQNVKVKPGWTSESSISVEVRIESPQQKGLKIPPQQFVRNQAEVFPGRTAPNSKRGRVLQDTKNSMQLRERLEINVTPKVVDIKHKTTTTTENPRTTEEFTPSTTTTAQTTIVVTPTSSTTASTTSTTTPSQTHTENMNLKNKKFLNSRASSIRRNNPYPSRRRPRNRAQNGARSIGKGTPNNQLTPAHIASQLGVNPHASQLGVNPHASQLGVNPHASQLGVNPRGRNPIGDSPFGLRPEGASPFGSSPHGISPLGINTTTTTANATTTTVNTTSQNQTESQQKTSPPAEVVKEERYHVQVKKADGSINGDYVVLNPFTGSLSGVRYEAVDGADQELIQQALLSFLSFDPRLDPRPTKISNTISSSVTGEDGQPPESKSSRQRRSEGYFHVSELYKKDDRT